MIPQLDVALESEGITGNRYGLVGFGSGLQDGNLGRPLAVGGGKFGTANEFANATNNLLLSGGVEDGYSAIDFALNNYTFREGVAVNFILVTDEYRNNRNFSLNFTNILEGLQRGTADTSDDILLNAVVNANFVNDAIGVNSEANAYMADGSGGFTTTQLPSLNGIVTRDEGTTREDYIDLALASGGAGWNLNQLRAGGLTATSFTNAFIDIKVEEIEQQQQEQPQPQDVPEPVSVFALFGIGALAAKGLKQKKEM
ncbi:MAG: PEP-CTERM sorting domain-containing protein [Okeania sp. SIO2F4]|uniref:hypothetical protein n=1 Tax=Okeania sp. SIO2F4 TaxID=2607790 RepID=UPI001429FF96|nr:hypothetical protein [Okeania sp. SIO2F4]NES03879.1 PEP-CTERM sorting domain-containing protein [Okeania sp. SIO2F4]